jgi:hypothetical protein
MTAKPVLPSGPPPETPAEDEEAFEALVDASLEQTRQTATHWRDALAALSALIVGAILFKGREDVVGIELGWKIAASAMIAAGLGCLIAGLTAASTAAFAQPTSITYSQLQNRFGDMRGYRTALAARAAERLSVARRLVMAGLPLLVAAGMSLWWAPAEPSRGSVEVVGVGPRGNLHVSCGESVRRAGRLVEVTGASGKSIPLDEVVSVRAIESC